MNDKDIPACPQSGPLLGLGSSEGLGMAPERDDYSQDVWECFCDMPKDGQKLRMLDVLMFGQACADKARAAERDCRTCKNWTPHHRSDVMHCSAALRCVAGSSYQRHGVVQLWEAAPVDAGF